MSNPPRIILALDSALSGCGGCLYDSAKQAILENQYEPMHKGQAERLIPLIDEIIGKGSIAYGDIDAIACTIGPGGFTGVRVGIAAAKALALALNVPLMGVTTFDVLYAQILSSSMSGGPNEQMRGREVCILIDTKRGDYFVQHYNPDGEVKGDPYILGAEDACNRMKNTSHDSILWAGAGIEAITGKISHDENSNIIEISTLDCSVLARISAERQDWSTTIHPFYLRDADIGTPRRQQRMLKK